MRPEKALVKDKGLGAECWDFRAVPQQILEILLKGPTVADPQLLRVRLFEQIICATSNW